MKISMFLIPLLLIMGAALLCSAEDTAQVFKIYGIYDNSRNLIYYMKGDAIYDAQWNLHYRVRNNALYDMDWQRRHFIKGNEIYDENRYLQYRIKEYTTAQ